MKKYGSLISFVFLLVINLFWVGSYIQQKQGLHVDDLFSYGHASSSEGAYLSADVDSYFIDKKTDLHNRWLDGKVFHDYLTVQDSERFHYGHIHKNLQVVEHPPLFYYLLHTVSSLTPDKFSPWQAGSINLVAFMLTLLVFYRFAKLFFKDNCLAMAPVFLWGFSAAGMATVIFFRMYALQTLFAVCLLYEVSKMMVENKADGRRLFLIFLYAALGNLTQFSSLVLAFVVAVVSDIVLLYRKNFKLMLKFSIIMLFSAAALFVIYPEALNIFFYSMRGTESAQKISDILGRLSSLLLAVLYSNTPSRIFEIYFSGLFGPVKVLDIALLAAVVLVGFFLHFRKIELNASFLPLLAIIILMTFYLYLMMPNMGVFQMRYYMLLMPVASLILVYITAVLLQALKLRQTYVTLFMALVVIAVIWQNDFKKNVFFVPISEETMQAKDMLKNKKIIVKSRVCAVYDVFGVLAQADKVYVSREDDDITTALDDADFVLYYNSYATLYTPRGKTKSCFFCIPHKRTLPENETARLKYATPFRSGVVNFDLYEVIKK